MADDFLNERTRAEDIILGSLGFGEDARIVTIEAAGTGFRGMGRFADGESFEFESEDELDDLQRWALGVLVAAPGGEKRGAARRRAC